MDSIIDFGFPLPASYTLERTNESIFAEASINPSNKLHITAGIRYDKTDDLSVTTNRLISRYQLNENTILSMQYSEGFKLPSFFALGHPFVGNSALKPEESENYELSIESQFYNNNLTSRVSIYQNTFKNLVDFDPIAFTNINRAKVRAKGSEIYLSYNASPKLIISGQVTYNKMDTFEAKTVLRRRPKWKGSLQASYKPTTAVSLSARFTANSNFYDSSVPTGMIEMDSYNRLDFSAVWSAQDNLSVRLNASNAFNSDHEEAVGFDNSGASLTASIAKHF